MPQTCFVVGPIGKAGTPTRRLADWILHGLIKPVLEEAGYTVKRADEDASPGSINYAVITDVVEADLVIADLTGLNPNAFYELGVRHAMRKPTIHVIAEDVDLPFDNKDQRTIFVDFGDYNTVQTAKALLKAAVTAIGVDNYRVINPFTQASALNAVLDSGDPQAQAFAAFEERLLRLEEKQPARSRNPSKSLRHDPDERFLLDSLKSWGTPKSDAETYWRALHPANRRELVEQILDRPYGDLSEAEAALFEYVKNDDFVNEELKERLRIALEEYYIDNTPKERF